MLTLYIIYNAAHEHTGDYIDPVRAYDIAGRLSDMTGTRYTVEPQTFKLHD